MTAALSRSMLPYVYLGHQLPKSAAFFRWAALQSVAGKICGGARTVAGRSAPRVRCAVGAVSLLRLRATAPSFARVS